jgi:predicted enzyme related to lactoylglutathione lyase
MPKVTGFGGAFLRANDPASLYAWYEPQLGIGSRDGCFAFQPCSQQATSPSLLSQNLGLFSRFATCMLNFQADDLDGVMQRLASAGVSIDPKREEYDYGRFAWFADPEVNRVELWQPPAQPAEN